MAAWGKMVMAVVEPAAISLGWLASAVLGGIAAPRPTPEVPVGTEPVRTSPEEDGPQDLPEIRAVIEQAKGILMATFRCGPDEASELLRRASRGGGVKVHVLAAKLVAQASRAVNTT